MSGEEEPFDGTPEQPCLASPSAHWRGESDSRNLLAADAGDGQPLSAVVGGESGDASQSGGGHPWRQLRNAARVAVASAAAAAVVGLALPNARPWIAGPGGRAPPILEASSAPANAAEKCHTAKQGESCYVDVHWAMNTGLRWHPEWYEDPCPHLRMTSHFEEFQACIVKINRTKCGLPCDPKGKGRAWRDAARRGENHFHKARHGRAKRNPCHVPRHGEECFMRVVEAMNDVKEGKRHHGHLDKSSKFEDFQAFFHRAKESWCPRPCACHRPKAHTICHKAVVAAQEDADKDDNQKFDDFQRGFHADRKHACPLPCYSAPPPPSHHHGNKQHGSVRHGAGHCRTLGKGDACYEDVQYAIKVGIFEHPAWYPGLTPRSAFEDFQNVLAKNPDMNCPRACKCKTALRGDGCYDHIQWVLDVGLVQHPGWYSGLSRRSRIEDFQQRLLDDEHTGCERPCSAPHWGEPSLFCFSVFRSKGYELDLVKAQVSKNAGIFSCDEFAVLSDESLQVSRDITTLRIPPCESVGKSKDGTAANTLIFMQAWNVIRENTRWEAHDWVIKVDPDAVVLPHRLRHHLKRHTGKNVFMKNCAKYAGPGWPMMFGSLEAISRDALEAYFKGAHRCKSDLDWTAWGEDLFMGNCLKMLGVHDAFDGELIGDNVCKGANCRDGRAAAYHPFKSVHKWFECYEQAMKG